MSIQSHVFHGIYSNNGYYPDSYNDQKYFYADTPLHVNRAINGAIDPLSSSTTIKKFETEKEAVDWYKKQKYGTTSYNNIKNKGEFCNNYFKISKNEFHKFRQYFNGMIKSVNIKSNVSISYNGTYSRKGGTEDCAGDSENLSWNTYFNFYINSNSSLILDDPSLQQRCGAKHLNRYVQIGGSEDNYDILYDTLQVNNLNIYDNKWEFQKNNFNELFQNEPNKFSSNSTIINDPIILNKDPNITTRFIENPSSIYKDPLFSSINYLDVPSTIPEGSNLDRTSMNIGEYSIKIDKTEYVYCYNNYFSVELVGTAILFIESLNTYLCFIELDILPSDGLYAKNSNGGPVSPAGLDGPSNPHIFSTSDDISTQDKPNLEIYNFQSDYYPVEKSLIDIIICNQQVKIEVWKMSEKSFTWSEGNDNIITPWGSIEVPSLLDNCITASFTKVYEFEQPYIEIIGWNQEEFQNTIYPPKIS